MSVESSSDEWIEICKMKDKIMSLETQVAHTERMKSEACNQLGISIAKEFELEKKLAEAVEENNKYWETLGDCMEFFKGIINNHGPIYSRTEVAAIKENAQVMANLIVKLQLLKIKAVKE